VIPNDGMGSDHDSVGIEQQRPSWGSVQDRMTPATAARFFFEHLLKIPGWEAMPVTVAAQHVQGSAFPDAYAKWEPLATQLVANAGLTPLNTGCTPGLTTTVSGAAGIAIQNAESKVGTAYQFGGSCLDPHSTVMSGHCDCSSLVMTAWAAAGKVLPRTSEAQYDAVQHITASPTTFAGLEPGDLLFYEPGGDGISGKPAHVAMYIGGGKLIEAPKPGDIVHVIPVYSGTWLGAGRVS
jgi:cell wall-associated NlpC family hydrolase